jgi:hypothetical protein
MTAPEITLALFYLFSGLRGAMYLPQIACLARHRGRAKEICCATWAFWTCANASTAAYAVTNVSDPLLFASGLMNMAGCAAVLAITLWKRHRFAALGAAR